MVDCCYGIQSYTELPEPFANGDSGQHGFLFVTIFDSRYSGPTSRTETAVQRTNGLLYSTGADKPSLLLPDFVSGLQPIACQSGTAAQLHLGYRTDFHGRSVFGAIDPKTRLDCLLSGLCRNCGHC